MPSPARFLWVSKALQKGDDFIVSVVMPTKDRYSYIERAIQSVQKQTYENWELLIADDSLPETKRRIQDLARTDSRLRVVPRPSGTGPCTARRLGVDASRGPFVTFIDSDDYYLPGRLKNHVDTWRANPGLGLSYDSWKSSDSGENDYIARQLKHLPIGVCAPPVTATRLFLGNFIHASSGFTTKRIIEFLGGYPEGPLVCDWYLFIKICEKYPVFRISASLSVKDSLAPDRVGMQRSTYVTQEFVRGKKKVLFNNPRVYARSFLRDLVLTIPVSLKNRDAKFLKEKASNLARMVIS